MLMGGAAIRGRARRAGIHIVRPIAKRQRRARSFNGGTMHRTNGFALQRLSVELIRTNRLAAGIGIVRQGAQVTSRRRIKNTGIRFDVAGALIPTRPGSRDYVLMAGKAGGGAKGISRAWGLWQANIGVRGRHAPFASRHRIKFAMVGRDIARAPTACWGGSDRHKMLMGRA
jgi:hypothetical protein